jgi:O-antigen/teichoic acid export membrane protein
MEAKDSAHSSPDGSFFSRDHLQTDLGGRTLRGGTIAVTTQGIKFCITIVATSILARLLTPEDYGLIGMVAFVIAFLSTYKDLGLAAATIQIPSLNSDQVSTLFWINVSVSASISLLILAISPLISRFYGESRLTSISAVTAIGFLISGFAVQHEALLRRQMRYSALAASGLVSMIVGYVVAIFMAWQRFGYWALVGSQLAVVCTNTLLMFLLCRWFPGWPKRNSGVKSMIRFGGHVTGFATINFFSRNLDNLLVGRVWGAQQLGVYSRAYQLMMLPIDQINEPLTSVAVPTLSTLADSPERYRKAYLRIIEKIALITMPGVALMIATADWIVQIVLGSKWSATAGILMCLGFTGMFQPIANTTGWLLLSQGRSGDMLRWGFISGPLIILSIFAGLPWGAFGVALSYSAVRVFINDPLLYWFVGRKGPVRTRDFYVTMAPFVISALLALLASVGLRYWLHVEYPLVGIVACLTLTVVVTFTVLICIPAGRKALNDVKISTFHLFNAKTMDA